MQIVIDIPEEDYQKVIDGRCPVAIMRDAIRNGTPLPKGHWIKTKDGYHRCDKCGSRGSAIKARYCHHCGAKMVEPQESEEV